MDREYFKNKFRTSTSRLNCWNYKWPGMYSVTICTPDRQCYFGEVKDDKVILSVIGEMVKDELLNIPKLRPYVTLDDYVIMPNHVHIIFSLKENDDFGQFEGRDTVNRVSTERKFGFLPPKSLSSIVNTFKGGVTRQCNLKNIDFHWQSNYYEHIIRDNDDLARIKQYIANNPLNWATSKNNPKNIK